MTTFTLIAYASDWTESCRGCTVDSGSSNFEMKIAYTKDSATYAYFQLLRQAFDENIRYGWDDITVLVNGSVFDELLEGMTTEEHEENVKVVNEIIEHATITFNAYKAEHERLAAEAKRIKEKDAADRKLKIEKELFEKLKVQFEGNS